jgi:hypothetical protein
MICSTWTNVDSQYDLNSLRDAYAWDETELVEFYGCLTNEPYFPEDISRTGSTNVNVHVLIEIARHKESDADFVELVLIGCDMLDLTFMQCPRFEGRVDSLKRVSIDEGGGADMRCARLIYRLIHDRAREEVRPHDRAYFKHGDSVHGEELL